MIIVLELGVDFQRIRQVGSFLWLILGLCLRLKRLNLREFFRGRSFQKLEMLQLLPLGPKEVVLLKALFVKVHVEDSALLLG